jgi:hypothetical protein
MSDTRKKCSADCGPDRSPCVNSIWRLSVINRCKRHDPAYFVWAAVQRKRERLEQVQRKPPGRLTAETIWSQKSH